ncbi:uncharacterized protein CXorf58-like isoform X1 [Saccostrea echinata]|uniref:uncharacterized protein CXorf58-like isoform X1 n=1 Tax=Saccostrea echinata TaxID=191078 RepID=UPI002A813485|nr:uncharacterized protein CXorf58-like isoform X1 [Saccostrea echinata]
MSESGSETKSPDTKSVASKTSINVKIPSAASKRGGTPTKSPGLELPDEIGSRALTTTPVSSKDYLAGTRPNINQNTSKGLRQPQKSERELIRQAAATIIERQWIAFRDKQMFRLLKHAVCAAENSLSKEILRKVCPKEAELLNDKVNQVRVRFRFGGQEFPPMIFFKIFIHTEGKGVKYLSGRRVIKPATEASEDSLRNMGNRKFYDQMLQDAMYNQQYKITDEIDVTTLKDYMQYLANVDEAPATLGGKENYWRKLTLDVLSRRTIFYDVIDYLYNQRITPRLRQEIPVLVQRPVSQEIKVQHIRAISTLRSESIPVGAPLTTPKSKMSGYVSHPVSSRRSRQAKARASKLRKMYGLDRSTYDSSSEGSKLLDSREPTAVSEEPDDYFDKYGITGEEGEDPEEWEREASKLYEWTQELSFNDDLIATPRLPLQT